MPFCSSISPSCITASVFHLAVHVQMILSHLNLQSYNTFSSVHSLQGGHGREVIGGSVLTFGQNSASAPDLVLKWLKQPPSGHRCIWAGMLGGRRRAEIYTAGSICHRGCSGHRSCHRRINKVGKMIVLRVKNDPNHAAELILCSSFLFSLFFAYVIA